MNIESREQYQLATSLQQINTKNINKEEKNIDLRLTGIITALRL